MNDDHQGPNPAILIACILAGQGENVDWRQVAEVAVMCEQLVDAQKPADPAAGG